MTLYEILGVDRKASKDQIKKAYRRLARQRHPDAGGDAEEFRELHTAYEVLLSDERRKLYDETGTFEETAADNTMAEVVPFLESCLLSVLEQLEKIRRKIKNSDIPALMIEGFESSQKDRAQAIKGYREGICELTELIERTSVEGDGPNLLADIARAKITDLEAQTKLRAEEIKIMSKAIKILKNHKFRFDKPSSGHAGSFGGYEGVFTGWGSNRGNSSSTVE